MLNGMQLLAKSIAERYGLSAGQAEQLVKSKTAERILTVLAEESGALERCATDLFDEKKQRAETIMIQAENKLREANAKEMNLKYKLDELCEKKKQLEEMEHDIFQFHTNEAADRVRLLEIFKSSVSIQTPQNNTAFISGCAAILSGCKYYEIECKEGNT